MRVGGEVDGLGVVDGPQVAPGERANGGCAVIGDEEDGGVAGGVVEADDGADVVAVERSHSAVWQEVMAGVSGSFERGEVVGWIGEPGGCRSGFGGGRVGEAIAEGGERELGKVGDRCSCRVDSGGEGLGFGAADGGEQVVFGVFGFAGEWEAGGVVTFADLGGLAAGGVEDRTVSGAGECDVGGFAVEACGADDEHGVAGDALALVDRHGVAVIEVAVGEVGVVEPDDLTGAQPHVQSGRLGVNGGDGAEHAVVDPDRMSVGSALVGVVAADQHAISGLERPPGDYKRRPVKELFSGGAIAGEPVQGGRFAAGARQQEGVAPGGVSCPPVVNRQLVKSLRVIEDADAVVG